MRKQALALVAVAALSAGLAAPASATLTAQLFNSSEILGIPTASPFQQAQTGPLVDSFDFLDDLPPLPNGEMRSRTEVDYGIIRLRSLFEVIADDFDPASTSLDGGASARGSFSDLVTIDAPGLTGTSGSFVPVVDMSGFLDADASGEDPPFSSSAEASVLITLSPGGQQRGRTCSTNVGSGPGCFFGDPLGVQVFDPVPFTFGTPLQLALAADCGLFNRTVPLGTSWGEADFRFTIRWLGFQQVLDASQQPVAGYTVSSGTGIDWSLPVPEPASGAGALAALATTAGLARFRPRSARPTPTRACPRRA